MKSIKKAVKYFGSNVRLAHTLGIRPDQVHKWLKLRAFPARKHAFLIEEASEGHITAKEILIEKAHLYFHKQIEEANKLKGSSGD